MMVLRATKLLAQKLNIKSLQNYDAKVSAFEEWYGHYFTVKEMEFILFTNAFSLYSTLVPGEGINNLDTFIELASLCLAGVLKTQGCEKMVGRFNLNNRENVVVSKTVNRSVQGSMNDMINLSQFYLLEQRMTPIEISKKLNETPFSYLKYKNPLAVIKQMTLS